MSDTNKDMSKSLKDTNSPLPSLPLSKGEEQGGGLSYTKTNKLITALYMVTDIMDTEEPIRNKLRTLGTEIISDMSVISKFVSNIGKINQIMSFLDIAFAMNFISEMNCAILKKEFLILKESIQESRNLKPDWLEEFLKTEFPPISNTHSPHPNPLLVKERGDLNYKGHTRIGVQKGSTLMQALSDRLTDVGRPTSVSSKAKDFDILKKQRRDEIINIIKTNQHRATITDIKTKATGVLISCSEKTLQRELVSMTKDGVLKKSGEKRWTQYSLPVS